jgi:putative peptidoglycan lipid II flippase
MALFSVSISIVFLPLFSRQAARGEKFVIVFLHTLRFLFFLIVPAMAGLILLREPIVKLFFFHGAFDLAAVNNTSEILLFLVLGLWAYAGTRIFVSFFYGCSDMRTPFIAGVITIFFNFLLSMVLIKLFGFKGLAISISISGILNWLILFVQLQSKKLLSYKDIGFSACRAVFISGIMCFIIKILILQINNILGFELSGLINIAISITIGVLVYFILNLLIKTPEIQLIRSEVLRVFKNK